MGVYSNAEARPGHPPTLEREVSLALVLAGRSVLAVYRRLLEPLGLTHPQYLVLVSLGQHNALSVKELGRLLQLDSATLSPLLKRLENRGLLVRQRSRHDERIVVVTLTERGLAMREEASAVPQEIASRLAMAGTDVDQLYEALRVVATAIEAEKGR
jgi:DNA-binding MarR family transcriptional regulator